MNRPMIYYCYDAYCGWCYGFSSVISKIELAFKDIASFEVLNGGMIIKEKPLPIIAIAGFIQKSYKEVEKTTGCTFGSDYLWHINNPTLSDWFPDSLKPAIALCIFKELFPEKQIAFAYALQHALFYEGRDLCDNEAYRHLLDTFEIDAVDFYKKLESEHYKNIAFEEFALCKQLGVSGFPCVYVHALDNKMYSISRGFASFEQLEREIKKLLF